MARRQLVASAALLICAVAAASYFLSIAWVLSRGDPQTQLIFVFLALVVALVFFVNALSGRAARRANLVADAKDFADRRELVAQYTFMLACLIYRAGSEWTLANKELPSLITVRTRRWLLDQIESCGCSEQLLQSAKHLLLLPDGAWSAQEQAIVLGLSEYLCVLRWILRLDSELNPLTRAGDYRKICADIVENPKALFKLSSLVAVWEIHPVLLQSEAFFNRCYAEAIVRGSDVGAQLTDEMRSLAREIHEEARRSDIRDVMFETSEIHELPEETFNEVYLRAARRTHCLYVCKDFLRGEGDESKLAALLLPELSSAQAKS